MDQIGFEHMVVTREFCLAVHAEGQAIESKICTLFRTATLLAKILNKTFTIGARTMLCAKTLPTAKESSCKNARKRSNVIAKMIVKPRRKSNVLKEGLRDRDNHK